MGYAPYLKIDTEIVDKLSFPNEACNYVYLSETKGKQVGTVYKTNSATYDKICDILEGDDQISINKGDKVYVLPGHPLASTRIKEYLKTIGATMTKSLNAATVIAGCNHCVETVENFDSQAKYASLMFHMDEANYVVANEPTSMHHTFGRVNNSQEISDKMEEEFAEGVPCILSSKSIRKIGFDQTIDLLAKEQFFMTGAGIEIIYYILAKGLKVLTAANVADNANSGLKLEDNDTYESIKQMLASGDSRNHKLGSDILIHCDLSGDTLYNLWRLAYNYNSEVAYGDHSKGLVYFLSRTNWNRLSTMTPEEFIEHAEYKEVLTSKIVEDLMGTIFKEKLEQSPVLCDPNDEWEENVFFECINNGDHSFTVQLKEKWRAILKKEVKDECSRLQPCTSN